MNTWLCLFGPVAVSHIMARACDRGGPWETKKETGRGLGPSTPFLNMCATIQIPSDRPLPQRVFTTSQFHRGLDTKPSTHDSLGAHSRSKLWDVPSLPHSQGTPDVSCTAGIVSHCWFSRSVVTIGFLDVYVYNWKVNIGLKIVKFFFFEGFLVGGLIPEFSPIRLKEGQGRWLGD